MINNKQPVVTMTGVTKQFLDTVASNNITFNLYAGEICALLGENGAGKTTLMNILFGYYTCDEGQIFIKGEKVNLSAPKDAITRGVGMIHQHFALVPSQTVVENIIIGTGSGKGIFLDLKTARRDITALQERFGLQVDPDAKIWTLSVGEQQKVEILKALYREVDILIMDEPTAVLGLLARFEPVHLTHPAFANELFVPVVGMVRAPEGQQRASHGFDLVGIVLDIGYRPKHPKFSALVVPFGIEVEQGSHDLAAVVGVNVTITGLAQLARCNRHRTPGQLYSELGPQSFRQRLAVQRIQHPSKARPVLQTFGRKICRGVDQREILVRQRQRVPVQKSRDDNEVERLSLERRRLQGGKIKDRVVVLDDGCRAQHAAHSPGLYSRLQFNSASLLMDPAPKVSGTR